MLTSSGTGASAWATVFNLSNSAVGAGVLSFPRAFHLTGWVGGLVLCPIVAIIVLIPLIVLAHKASKHSSRTYQGLVRDTLGPAAATFVAWTVFLYLCGACTAFMMICGSSFQALLQRFVLYNIAGDIPASLSSRWLSILVPATFIILPLSLLPNMTALAFTSSLALAVYTFNVTTVASEFAKEVVSRPETSPIVPEGAETFHWQLEAVKALPIMIFANQCHVQSVPIFSEMTNYPRLLRCSKPASTALSPQHQPQSTVAAAEITAATKLRGVVPVFFLTFVQITVLYTVMGLSGYLLFPKDTESNILDNFPVQNNLMLVISILVGFAVALHYPIDLHVARTAMYDLVCECIGRIPVHPAPYKPLAVCTLTIWGGSLVLACLITDLGLVYQVLGGVACSLLIFILPGLMLLFDGSFSGFRAVAEPVASDMVESHSLDVSSADGVPLLGSGGVGNGASESPSDPKRDEADAKEVATEVEPAGSRAGPEWATKVLGWGLVTFGSCLMCLTVYLTVFG